MSTTTTGHGPFMSSMKADISVGTNEVSASVTFDRMHVRGVLSWGDRRANDGDSLGGLVWCGDTAPVLKPGTDVDTTNPALVYAWTLESLFARPFERPSCVGTVTTPAELVDVAETLTEALDPTNPDKPVDFAETLTELEEAKAPEFVAKALVKLETLGTLTPEQQGYVFETAKRVQAAFKDAGAEWPKARFGEFLRASKES